MSLEHYEKIIKESKKFRDRPKQEQNIFTIGARGHYENPISDLMSFFINPYNEHCFKELLLKSLINCASKFDSSIIEKVDIYSFISSSREVVTQNGKKLDIVIEGENWTICIENKITAPLRNPLDEYELFISEQFKNKNNFFIILAKEHIEAPPNWISITYKDLISSIKNFIGAYLLEKNVKIETKWIIFFREFLLNLINEIGESKMDEKELHFIQKYFGDINKIIKMRDEYINYVIDTVKQILNRLKPGYEITNKIHIWNNNDYAIRFFMPDYWFKGTNIVFVIKDDKTYMIRVYFYGLENEDIETIDKLKNLFSDFRYWTEGVIQCFGKDKINKFEECLKLFEETAKKVNKFYDEKSPN